MPGFFPGMDPYLESQAYWPDFHAHFITYWRDALADALPDHYEVRIDERFNLVELLPDPAIIQCGPSTAVAPASPEVATLQPVTIPLWIEEGHRETYLKIRNRSDRTLVAVLEL